MFWKAWSPFLALVAVLSAMMVPRLLSQGEEPSDGRPGGQGGRPPQPVVTQEVSPAPYSKVLQLNGNLITQEKVDLQAEAAGRVTGIFFEDGQIVQEGDLLVKLLDDTLQAEKERLMANLDLATLQKNRQEQLFSQGGTSREQLDEALIRERVLRAELSLANARIDKTEIKAPFKGQIGFRQISVGTLLQPGQTLAHLENLDSLQIEFRVPEKYASRLQNGMSLSFLRDNQDNKFAATLVSTDPRIDLLSRTVACRALVEEPQPGFLPGGFVRVELPILDFGKAIRIPATAIITEIDRQIVFVADDQTAREVEVTTGLREGGMVQITSGLNGGEKVITIGNQNLRNGSPIAVTSESAAQKG